MNIPFELIEPYFAQFSLTLDTQAKQRLNDYAELLVEWNQKMNLTTIVEPREIAIKHFLDSLLLLKYCKVEQGAKLIDVGTGAGFPGMVLKIVRPDILLTLMDSLNKRTVFLSEVAKALGLEATIIHSRAEDGANGELREQFDIATARAVAAMPVLCEYCLPYTKVGGVFIAMKGPGAEQETIAAKRAISLLGGGKAEVFTTNLPNNDIRTFVKIKKISQTPTKYPRKTPKILKQSL